MNKSILFFAIFISFQVHADQELYDNDAVIMAIKAYERGDNATAFAFWKKAAETGDKVGQYNLGQMYLDGIGTKKDSVEAFKWFQKAADQGDISALTFVGAMYTTGEGVARDEQRGILILRKNAMLGDEKAKNVLAQYEEQQRRKITAAEAGKKVGSRSISDRIEEVLDTNLNLGDEEARAIIRRTFPKCANVQFSGPIAGSYREMHVFAQINREMINGRDGGTLFRQIEVALDRGLTCRRDVMHFTGCQGFSFSDAERGELATPTLANYKKYGLSYADYVEIYKMQTFKTGRNELVPIFVEKRNMRCIGSVKEPGMYSGRYPKLPE